MATPAASKPATSAAHPARVPRFVRDMREHLGVHDFWYVALPGWLTGVGTLGLFAVHDYRLSGAIVWDDPNYRLGRGECVTPPAKGVEGAVCVVRSCC